MSEDYMKRVHVARKFLSIILCSLFCVSINAQTILKNNHPAQYQVKKGDTLWDIAGVFLNSPWLWPDIWQNNTQIKNPHLIYPNDIIYLSYRDGRPQLSFENPSFGKLSPKIRVLNQFTPITAIPKIALQAFVASHRIVDSKRVENMPYVLAGSGLRKLIGKGDEVFVRGVLDPDFNQYHVYRIGKVYGTKQGFAADNTEIVKVGELEIIDQQGEISRALVTRSNGLIHKGDFIVRAQELQLRPLYFLAAAPDDLQGTIVSAVNENFQIARYDGVVLDLGLDSGVVAGHVFNIVKAPISVVDPKTQELVEITNQVSGKVMVVNVFNNLSYAIVLNADDAIAAGDIVSMTN